MSLTAEERHDVVAYRIEKANKTLEEAKSIIAFKYWNLIANRLYYAAYYAISALLVANGYLTKSHDGTINLFGLHLTKALFPQKWGNLSVSYLSAVSRETIATNSISQRKMSCHSSNRRSNLFPLSLALRNKPFHQSNNPNLITY